MLTSLLYIALISVLNLVILIIATRTFLQGLGKDPNIPKHVILTTLMLISGSYLFKHFMGIGNFTLVSIILTVLKTMPMIVFIYQRMDIKGDE